MFEATPGDIVPGKPPLFPVDRCGGFRRRYHDASADGRPMDEWMYTLPPHRDRGAAPRRVSTREVGTHPGVVPFLPLCKGMRPSGPGKGGGSCLCGCGSPVFRHGHRCNVFAWSCEDVPVQTLLPINHPAVLYDVALAWWAALPVDGGVTAPADRKAARATPDSRQACVMCKKCEKVLACRSGPGVDAETAVRDTLEGGLPWFPGYEVKRKFENAVCDGATFRDTAWGSRSKLYLHAR
jgi:hypothetical protein